MTALRQGPSGPAIIPAVLLASVSGSPAASALATLASARSQGGISVSANYIRVTQPGLYKLTGVVDVLQSVSANQYLGSRLEDGTQARNVEMPLNDGGTVQGNFPVTLVNLFNITDPATQGIAIRNESAAGIVISSGSILVEQVG